MVTPGVTKRAGAGLDTGEKLGIGEGLSNDFVGAALLLLIAKSTV
jgi:hypothetical protein